MPLTDKSPIFARFHEDGFNIILREIMLQRPEVFNYATQSVLGHNSLCSPIAVNPILETTGIETCTIVDRLPIVGLNDPSQGVDFCAQVTELKIDFQPSNQITLPPELTSLGVQEFSLKGRFCAGISCGSVLKPGVPGKRKDELKTLIVKTDKKLTDRNDFKTGIILKPFETLNMMCFCLNIYAKLVLVRDANYLKLNLIGIEIEDISPLGLENSIECYIRLVLDKVIFPQMKIAIEDLVFNASSYFTIGLAPISSSIPYNPAIANDYVSIFVNLI